MVIYLVNNLNYLTFLFAFLTLIGCTEMGAEDNQGGKHLEHVYEAAENHVTFPYELPYFKDYTIVDMHYTPQNQELETEEILFVSYNADIFVTAEMKESMQNNSKEINEIDENEEQLIYGPYYEAEDNTLSINLIMKRSPFEIVVTDKDKTVLDSMEIEGKEVIYAYSENITTSHGMYSYFIFEVERDETYYRIYVEITSKMTKDEIVKQIKEMSLAILS